jgi:hypothetical protein
MCGGLCAPPGLPILSVNSFYKTMRPRHPDFEESTRSSYGDQLRAYLIAKTAGARFYPAMQHALPSSRILMLPQAVAQMLAVAGESKRLLFSRGCGGRVPKGSGESPEQVLPLHLIETNKSAGIGVVFRTIYGTRSGGSASFRRAFLRRTA